MEKLIYRFLVRKEDSLRTVMKTIDLNGYGVALVIGDDQKFIGIATDGDVRRSLVEGIALETSIDKIMNPNAITLQQGFSPSEVKNIIGSKNLNNLSIRHLPVLDSQKRVVDILFKDDLVQILGHSSSLFSESSLAKKNKHVLVIGGAGYVGSILVRKLLDEGYSVKVFDLFLFGESSLEELKQNEHFSIIDGDIGHINKVIDALTGVDAVIHLGEIVGDPACAIDSKKTQQINYLSTKILADVCKYFQIMRQSI